MNLNETLSALRSAGSEQTRKTYRRHGVKGEMFGVSYATLGKLKKAIKVDHELAEQLWETNNHDARILATMIGDPGRLNSEDVARWAAGLDNHVIAGALAGLAGRAKIGRTLMARYIESENEWAAVFGWDLLAQIAMTEDEIDDAFFEKHLRLIERQIHDAANMARYAMNGALIAIGLRNTALREKALSAAGRIGRVEVDHGDTNCKTPDAVAYIRKAAQRKMASK